MAEEKAQGMTKRTQGNEWLNLSVIKKPFDCIHKGHGGWWQDISSHVNNLVFPREWLSDIALFPSWMGLRRRTYKAVRLNIMSLQVSFPVWHLASAIIFFISFLSSFSSLELLLSEPSTGHPFPSPRSERRTVARNESPVCQPDVGFLDNLICFLTFSRDCPES